LFYFFGILHVRGSPLLTSSLGFPAKQNTEIWGRRTSLQCEVFAATISVRFSVSYIVKLFQANSKRLCALVCTYCKIRPADFPDLWFNASRLWRPLGAAKAKLLFSAIL